MVASLRYILILCLGVFLFSRISHAQNEKRFQNWHFGDHFVVDHLYQPPLNSRTSGINTHEGCATISDRNGSLLFYTDGSYVWDRNNDKMPNGYGLLGGNSSTMAAVAVPVIGNHNQYYLFTVDEAEDDGVDGLNYSIVDMSLRNGLGDIVPTKKNIQLTDSTQERVIAISGNNPYKYWIVAPKYSSNIYYAYEIDCSGIDTVPIISIVGNEVMHTGYMRPSYGGNVIATGVKKIQVVWTLL